MKGFLFSAKLLLALACQEAPTPPTREAVSGDSQSATPTSNTTTQQTPTTPGAGPLPSASPTVRELDDTQATSLVRGSCIYAGCHADVTVLMASPNLLTQVQNNLMPPPNQARYTLNTSDRAALVSYLQKKSAALRLQPNAFSN